ncbi:dicarboxylate/amino acid:cation symporter [Saccharophagus sp. K07]|jgi:proton glutamate symport protein|uniref:dicarboxylate/amino acid:cation symporter n=1 Tax=Saccharophagus sp. K07 TaxID=2283636 RepID=UPI001CA313EA|nr:dicarboxylate/amino acid:cation symporter [Saccharophagus sp. K07]MBC6904129.1 dicarboxylate/amino acid:cation symporter [Saccharophagus sp. K07]
MKLHWQILLAIGLAVVVGSLLEPEHGIGSFTFLSLFNFLGTLFLNALHMIVVPLIVSSIICGVASAGAGQNLGRIGLKTIGLYTLSTLLAVLMGLFLVNLTSPGIIDGQAAGEQLNLSSKEELESSLSKVEGRSGGDIAGIFLRMIPTNVVASAAKGDMLGLIVFSLLFGVFMLRVSAQYSATLKNFWQGVFEVMMAMTMFVMRLAPLGVFGLVAKTIMSTGFAAFGPLLVFFFTVVAALLLHTFVSLALMLRMIGGINPLKHYRAMIPAMLTAFSTASSSATLPVTIECLEKNAGVSNRTSSFVLPLGATINMDGTALYECAAALFIAQAYGLDLSFTQQFLVVVLALLTSIGVAGIPAASLVAISVILTAVGLPLEGIGLLLVTDRILDMMRTAVNVFSDSCCAVIVASTEGETGLYGRAKNTE